VNLAQKKILILSYYWPPAGGSGVQRWMYFAKYLKQLGYEPIIITVDETKASYPVIDSSLIIETNEIRVIKTSTREPLRWYSILISGDSKKGIPQGEVKTSGLLAKLLAFIRGNYFIPDARKGWIPFAVKEAKKILKAERIDKLITTGPPHSTHLAGLKLKKQFDIKWWADFRDPWTDIFYNTSLYRSEKTIFKDQALEKEVLQDADGVITTLAGKFHEQLKGKAPNQNFSVIPNGYDSDLMKNIKVKAKKGDFHIVYTGLLTQNQEYEMFLKVIDKRSKTLKIHFSLAGNIHIDIIKKITDVLPNVTVEYLGYITHNNAIALMKSADLLLNFVFKGAEHQMLSGKLLEYIATEVPILSIGNPKSEAGLFLNKGSHSWMVEKDNKSKIELILKTLIDKKVKNKFPKLSQWSRLSLTKKLSHIIFSE
jgi:hypothetical protein